MNAEIFVDYIFDNRYMIGNGGTIKKKAYTDNRNRYYPERIYAQVINTSGYPFVNFCKGPKYVHRLMAMHFISNPDNKPEVNHKNGIKTDFSIENLEWVTRKENQQHSWKFLNRKAVWQEKYGYSHHASVAVNQFDVDGNFITQYGSKTLASTVNGWHRYSVQWAIDKKGGYYKGYYWSYAN